MPARASGFSLIELLVVVVIIGVIALAATLSIGGSTQNRLQREADRFEALTTQACEQAELGGREIGVTVDTNGYAFRVLAGAQWQNFPDDSPLRARHWLDGMTVALAREGRPVDLRATHVVAPQIVCFSSGELTPFALTVGLGDATRIRVSGADDATLTHARVESSP